VIFCNVVHLRNFQSLSKFWTVVFSLHLVCPRNPHPDLGTRSGGSSHQNQGKQRESVVAQPSASYHKNMSRVPRKHCSFQESFISGSRGCYMWMSFDHDTIHVRSTAFWGQESLSLGDIKHLRTELINERGKVVEEDWCHYHLAKMRDFPKLKICWWRV